MRTSFDFHIGFCNILSHNSHTKQLDSANACHDTYQRRPAGNRIPEYQCAYDFRDDCNKRNHGEHQPQIRGNLQRNIRKIDNPIKRIAHKFPETPLGFSRRPFYILKFQPFGIISDPGKDSLGKPVVFADGKNGIYHCTVHQTVIPCPICNLNVGKFPHNFIKHACKKRTDLRLSLPVHPPGCHIVTVSGF